MVAREKMIETLRAEQPYLKTEFGIKKIAIFGSFARGKASKNSDVDLVIEYDRPLGLEFFRLYDYLEKRLGRKLDILTPEGIKAIRSPKVARAIKASLKYV